MQYPKLDAAYRKRLCIPPSDPLPPDADTLRRLVEAHLRWVPFENLSLHGCRGSDEPPIPLTLPLLREKILGRRRGGCCFELNGLLGHYLLELGFPVVRLVPCWIYAGPERGHGRRAAFRTRQTHALLLVRTASGEGFLVDVGLGEPPLHPLSYGAASLGVSQDTPEGMRSRIVREEREWTDGDGRLRRCLRMEWFRACRWCAGGDSQRGGAPGGPSRETAESLRSLADRALRKSRARPRAPFKVFATTPAVQEAARDRLRRQPPPAGEEAGALKRTICGMWAALSSREQEAYRGLALRESEDWKREAVLAEERAAEAAAAAGGDGCERGGCGGGWWEPRLQWDVSDAPLEPAVAHSCSSLAEALESFGEAAAIVASEGSPFTARAVVCVLTRSSKTTLAGRSLRVTSPRFPAAAWPEQSRSALGSGEAVRAVLENRFGLAAAETKGLVVAARPDAGDRLWDHL